MAQNVTTVDTGGDGTFTVPAGVTLLDYVILIGGGGSGIATNAVGGLNHGGCSGACILIANAVVTPGQVLTYSVAHAAPGIVNDLGTDGEQTLLVNFIDPDQDGFIAFGGERGDVDGGGTFDDGGGLSVGSNGGNGGLPGSGTTGGAGAGTASPNHDGGAASGTTPGVGGISLGTITGNPDGGHNGAAGGTNGQNGVSATAPGAGGGGAGSGTGHKGGDGAAGRIIFVWTAVGATAPGVYPRLKPRLGSLDPLVTTDAATWRDYPNTLL